MKWLLKLFTYLKEARQEVKKVNWPTGQEVLRKTLLVVAFSAVVTVVLGGFDFIFNRGAIALFTTQGAVDPVEFGGTVPLPDLNLDAGDNPIEVEVVEEEPGEDEAN